MKKEVWKDIPGYEGLYQASNMGNIKSLKYNKTTTSIILLPHKLKNGYLRVTLQNGNKTNHKLVHRLVLETFVGPSGKLECNHKDGVKENNIIENLEWVTHSYNIQHRNKELGFKTVFELNHPYKGIKGIKHFNSKCIKQFNSNNFIRKWDCITDVERELGITRGNISSVCKGKRKTAGGFIWKYEK